MKLLYFVRFIINDITRPTPYEIILPPLLDELHQIGIKKENILFMVATGIHRSNSQEEIKEMFGEHIFSAYPFMNHDCDDPHLKDLGELKSGNKLLLNPIVSDIDFIITTGWKTTWFELMKLGERSINMARIFNYREGFTSKDDTLPEVFYQDFKGGPFAYFGNIRTLFPVTSGQRFGIIRTAFRPIRTPCRIIK